MINLILFTKIPYIYVYDINGKQVRKYPASNYNDQSLINKEKVNTFDGF